MLDNWSGMDKEKTKDYILRCQVCEASALTGDRIRELSQDSTIFWTYMFAENVCVHE